MTVFRTYVFLCLLSMPLMSTDSPTPTTVFGPVTPNEVFEDCNQVTKDALDMIRRGERYGEIIKSAFSNLRTKYPAHVKYIDGYEGGLILQCEYAKKLYEPLPQSVLDSLRHQNN